MDDDRTIECVELGSDRYARVKERHDLAVDTTASDLLLNKAALCVPSLGPDGFCLRLSDGSREGLAWLEKNAERLRMTP